MRTRSSLQTADGITWYYEQEFFKAIVGLDDETISKTVSDGFASRFPGDTAAWEGLGEECHARFWKNYPRWARGYGLTLTPSIPFDDKTLASVPLDWSVGADTPTAMFLDNIVLAVRAGITVRTLPSTHFPYISDPASFSAYIVEHATKHL